MWLVSREESPLLPWNFGVWQDPPNRKAAGVRRAVSSRKARRRHTILATSAVSQKQFAQDKFPSASSPQDVSSQTIIVRLVTTMIEAGLEARPQNEKSKLAKFRSRDNIHFPARLQLGCTRSFRGTSSRTSGSRHDVICH